jgi:hypothetical protein
MRCKHCKKYPATKQFKGIFCSQRCLEEAFDLKITKEVKEPNVPKFHNAVYDSLLITPNQVNYKFFLEPVNYNKHYNRTNMQVSGYLPVPYLLTVNSILFWFDMTSNVSDIKKIRDRSHYELIINCYKITEGVLNLFYYGLTSYPDLEDEENAMSYLLYKGFIPLDTPLLIRNQQHFYLNFNLDGFCELSQPTYLSFALAGALVTEIP